MSGGISGQGPGTGLPSKETPSALPPTSYASSAGTSCEPLSWFTRASSFARSNRSNHCSDPEIGPVSSAIDSSLDPASQTPSTNFTSDARSQPTEETSQGASQPSLAVPGKPKKKRSLLKVPSRSSSHTKQEPSATSTAFTGATATDERTSAGDSAKNSIAGREGKGSRTSSLRRRAQQQASGPTSTTPMASGTQTTAPKKKSSFFMSFLNCCGGPTGNAGDTDDSTLPPKPAAVPKAQPVRGKQSELEKGEKATGEASAVSAAEALNEKSTVANGGDAQTASSEQQLDKKPPMPREAAGSERDIQSANAGTSGTSAYDTAVPPPPASEKAGIPFQELQTEDSKHVLPTSNAPDSVVTAPVVTPEWPQKEEKRSSDVLMGEAPPLDQHEAAEEPLEPVPEPEPEAPATQPELPPPPPRVNKEQEPLPTVGQEKQQWLLPPAQAPLKGRKCLVLDLDETLVHSSFKVSHLSIINHATADVQKILNQADFTIPVEIEGQYHNVYVIKRPGVDQFMKRVGELYEVVVFTASVSKVGLAVLPT